MPTTFSAATCLTSSFVSPGPFNIYLTDDYGSTPFSSVTKNQLTTNCPFIFSNIPAGTTTLYVKDVVLLYCFTIPIKDNNICSNCNLGFSNYSSSTISKLYCGNLTGSCTPINEYLINWYGPNNTTTLSFQSGKGSFVTVGNPNYVSGSYTHPFSTLTSSIPRESGVYTPVIEKIILSGVTFSNTGGTGNILFSGACLPTTNILPLTCDVATNPYFNTYYYPYSAYTNYLSFDSNTGAIPQPVSTTYQISASTKYIAWNFIGEQFVDRITISFSGSSYGTNKIGLEDFFIGENLPSNNFSASTYPKSADTVSSFIKYTCLTGFTVNNNDNIIIDITPATSNTRWNLYMSCLDNYNCNDCLNTQNYKIIGSTISGTTSPCNETIINFNISGCSYPDSSSDYLDYYLLNDTIKSNNIYSCVNNFSTILTKTTQKLFSASTFCETYGGGQLSTDCSNPSLPNVNCCQTDSTITKYGKTFLTDGSGRGVFGFTGSSKFISTYYESIKNAFLGLPPYDSSWSGSTNPGVISYYRYYQLKLPSQSTVETCGDGRADTTVYIHHTSPYITGTTISGVTTLYYLHLTANTISPPSFTTCQINCNQRMTGMTNLIKSYSTGTTVQGYGIDREFDGGIYYSNPLYYFAYFFSGNTTTDYQDYDGYFVTPDWSFNTYPFSGNPSTIIPSLSGTVCNYNSTGVYGAVYNSFYKEQWKYSYKVKLTNPLNGNDFDILASPITNFSYSGAPYTKQYELAYRYSGGNVTYSSSTYIIG